MAPPGHSRKNVCQRAMLFEALSPLETYLSNKIRETSTNYTLNQFETVDVARDQAIAGVEGQASLHSDLSVPDACGELAQLRQVTRAGFLQPFLQALALSVSQHVGKAVSKLIGTLYLSTGLADEGQVLLVGSVQAFGWPYQEPNGSFCRKGLLC
ncbi:MAG: hypothetical protein ACXVDN_13935, partial [Ktedonobacteraceae bacterium]